MYKLSSRELIRRLAIFAMVSFVFFWATAGICYAFTDKMSRRSSLTPPRYVVSASDKTHSILYQPDKVVENKNMLENKMQFMIKNTANKLKEASRENLLTDLKKKRGARDRGPGGFVTVNIPVNNVVVEQALNEIAEEYGVEAGAIDYEALINGNTLFTWNMDGIIYARIYNETASVLDEIDHHIIIGDIGDNEYRVHALADGGFVFGYSTNTDSYFRGFDLMGRFADQRGWFSVETAGDELTSITSLADGSFALAWKGNNNGYFQIFGSDGLTLGDRVNITSGGNGFYEFNLTTLANGNLAAVWITGSVNNRRGFFNIYNPFGSSDFLFNQHINISDNNVSDAKVVSLSNGDIAVSWSDGYMDLYVDVYGSEGEFKKTTHLRATGGNNTLENDHLYIAPDVTELPDGRLLVLFGAYIEGLNFNKPNRHFKNRGYYMSLLDDGGDLIDLNGNENLFDDTIRISDSKYHQNITVDVFSDNTFGLRWYNIYTNEWTYNQYGLDGSLGAYNMLDPLTREEIFNMPDIARTFYDADYTDFDKEFNDLFDTRTQLFDTIRFDLSTNRFLGKNFDSSLNSDSLVSIFRNLIAEDKEGALSNDGMMDPALLARLVEGGLESAALSLPIGEVNPVDMEVAIMLVKIFKSPTEEQKKMLDAVTQLIEDLDNIEGDFDFRKEQDELIRVFTAVLLVQAISGALDEVTDISAIFSAMDRAKTNIMLRHEKLVDSYYSSVIKVFAKNFGKLKIRGILSDQLTEDIFKGLPRNEIDKIVRRLRMLGEKDKLSSEEESILLVIAESEAKYLVPSERLIKENMEFLLRKFTKSLYVVLKEAGLVKEEGSTRVIDLSARKSH